MAADGAPNGGLWLSMRCSFLCIALAAHFISLAAWSKPAASRERTEAVQKVLRSIEATGFVGCRDAASRHFEYLTGEVHSTAKMVEGIHELLILQVTSGSAEFAVYQSATIHRSAGKCIVTSTSVVSYPFDCTRYLQNNPSLQVRKHFPGHVLAQDRGVDVVLRSVGTNCTTTVMNIEGFVDDARSGRSPEPDQSSRRESGGK